MATKYLLLFLFVIVAPSLSGQSLSEKILKGKVVAQGKDVTGVAIQNLTTKKATITDLEGHFSIKVKLNDTLVFSAVQFKRKIIPVNALILNTDFVTIPLEEFVNELKEVVVQPYNLSGDLNQDLNGLQLEKDVSAEALSLPNAHRRIPTQSERKLQQATYGKFNVGMLLSPPLDPIINAITGRTKMLKNRVKVDKTYARTQQVQNFYVDSLFIQHLRIPTEKIDDFMYFCEVDAAFQTLVNTGDKLKIWDFLINKSVIYRKNNGLDE